MRDIQRFVFTLTLICFSLCQAGGKSGLYFDESSNQYFIDDKVSFSIRPRTGEKFVDKIQVSIDDQQYSDYDGNIRFDKDGFHIVRFKAVDPVLNWSPIQSFRIYVDLTPPKSNNNWAGEKYSDGESLFVNGKAKLVLSSQDNLSGVSKILWKEGGKDKSFVYKGEKVFKEGKHRLQISAVDNVGNQEEWREFNFVVDSTAPTTKSSVKGNSFTADDRRYIDKGSFVSLNASDKISGVSRIEYQLNGVKILVYNNKIAIDRVVNKIKYRSVDNVGNTEEWKKLTIHLDLNAPDLILSNKGRYKKFAGKIFARAGFEVHAKIKDDESGAKTIIKDNDRSNKIKERVLIYKKAGNYEVLLGAEDNVGNTSDFVGYSIVIDEKAPETKMTSSNKLVAKGKVLISSLPNKLEFLSNDTGGVGVEIIEISYDGKKYKKISGPVDLATWDTANRNVYYRAQDKLGNLEKPKVVRIEVRKNGPNVDLFVEKGDVPPISLTQLREREKSKKKKAKTTYTVKKKKRRPASKKRKSRRKRK